MNAQREKLTDELIEAIERKNAKKTVELVQELGHCISQDIGNAINPINGATAPIIISYLEAYAKVIREKFPKCQELVDEIKNGKIDTFEMTMPRSRRW